MEIFQKVVEITHILKSVGKGVTVKATYFKFNPNFETDMN